ncbi:MAG: hypothetical protein ACFCBU_08455 [Cyanophyceae cyanobacterium]
MQKLETGTDLQRSIVIEALRGIDSPESVAALKAATDKDTLVAKAPSRALRKLGYVDLELLKTELTQVGAREEAIATLGSMKKPESLQR